MTRTGFAEALRGAGQWTRARLRTVRVRIGPGVRHLDSALHRGVWRKRMRHPPRGVPVDIRRADGFSLAGSLYRSVGADGGRSPATLILHGWDPEGQRHGLYLALAEALVRRGHVVLTMNFRGYPGSDVPAGAWGFTIDELVGDVIAAVDALAARPDVNRDQVTLLGHSYGADVVLPVLSRRSWLETAVVYGPSIWMDETITGPAASHREFYHERYTTYMTGVNRVPMRGFLRLARDLYIPNQIGRLPANHPPILVLDGADEPDRARAFSRHVLDLIPPPVDYWSIPKTDHFCNTSVVGGVLVEDVGAIESLVEGMTEWAAGVREARGAAAGGRLSGA